MTIVAPTNLPKAPQRWALAMIILGVLIPSLAATVMLLSRDRLFPSNEQRYDVTELWVAGARDLCPGVTADSLADDLANCTAGSPLEAQKSSTAFARIPIPPLNESAPNAYADFTGLLRAHNATTAISALLEQRPIIVGFQLPRRLFLANRLGTVPNVLVLAGSPDARICYAGSCPHFLDRDLYLTLQFPLFIADGVSPGPMVDVWLVFVNKSSSFAGPNLEHGIFAAASPTMRNATHIHKPLITGVAIIRAAVLLGIALMAMLYAILWVEYIDFAAFAVLVNLQFLQAIFLALAGGISIQLLSANAAYSIKSVMQGQVLVAAIFFAIATQRPSPRTFWWSWLGINVVTAILLGIVDDVFSSRAERIVMKFVLAALAICIPAAITAIGGVLLYRRLERPRAATEHPADAKLGRRTIDQGLGNHLASIRRLREQLVMTCCLVVAGLPDMIAAFMWTQGRYTYDVSSLSCIAVFPIFAALIYSAGGKFRSRAEAYRLDLIAATKKAAIGEMVQMLAHDVRKPFSLLRMGMDLLERASSPAEIAAVLNRLKPQVAKAMRAVTAMLDDIMAVNSEPTLASEAVTVDALIFQCLQDTFIMRPNEHVRISYAFDHQALLWIDAPKILRVLNNIVENALQATASTCELWFATRQIGPPDRAWIELTVGNTGSFIEPEKWELIFAEFFTQGKANGTGLGLAIARTFTLLHGGGIRCVSDPIKGTQFILTLPTALTDANLVQLSPQVALPASSRFFSVFAQTHVGQAIDSVAALSGNEADMVANMMATAKQLGRPLRLLIVDDEVIYSAALAALLKPVNSQSPTLVHSTLEIVTATSSSQALVQCKSQGFDLGIFDVDLGESSYDGMDLARRLKSEGLVRHTCIHSNRSLPSDFKRALDMGADSVRTKPMSRTQLMELLVGSCEDITTEEPGRGAALDTMEPAAGLVLVVDDDIFIQEAWAEQLRPTPCLTFASPRLIMAWLTSHPKEAAQVTCVVLDYYLDDALNGIELAEHLSAHITAPIFLSTDAPIILDAHSKVTAIIPKMPETYLELLGRIQPGAA